MSTGQFFQPIALRVHSQLIVTARSTVQIIVGFPNGNEWPTDWAEPKRMIRRRNILEVLHKFQWNAHKPRCCCCCCWCSMNWVSDKRLDRFCSALATWYEQYNWGCCKCCENSMLCTHKNYIHFTQPKQFRFIITLVYSWTKLRCWSECNCAHDCSATFRFVLYINSLTTRAVVTSTAAYWLEQNRVCVISGALFSPVFFSLSWKR